MAGPGSCAGCGRSRRTAGSTSNGRSSVRGRARGTSAGSDDGGRSRHGPGAGGRRPDTRPAPRAAAGRSARRAGGRRHRRGTRGGSVRPPRQRGGRRTRPARPRRGRGPRATAAPARGSTGGSSWRAPAGERPAARPGGGGRPRPGGDRGRDPRPLLLDGVTGGGKTAIYIEAIATSLEAGRPALVLVPEIALALPLVDRLRADLDARVALVHSGLGDGERADEWRRIRAGEVDIVVGTRLAVLAPLADVGLIVVDEEHDAAYKSDRTPRLQARDVAIRLAGLAGAAIVLGSATPAVESVGRARGGAYDRVVLPARPVGAAPEVEIVDLRAELAAGQRGILSRALVAALAGLDTAARRAGDPRPQPARDRVGRPVPRLRPRPGLPGLRAAARLPPGRHDAALPPLRPRHAARVALPGLRLAADPLPRRRHRTRRARGPRHVSRACVSVGSIATSSSTAAPPSGSSTPSPTAASTSSSGRASSPRASTSRRSRSSASSRPTSR